MEKLSEPTGQVRIQLTTHDLGVKLPDDTGPILISRGLRRYALSTLVNHVLETEQSIPFEFLVNGQFLRTSIDKFMTTNGISSEVTLLVEYVKALIPPTHVVSFEHDDWVASVDVLSSTSPVISLEASSSQLSYKPQILSASYDGHLRVWSTAGALMATTEPSSTDRPRPIKTARFLTPTTIVSAGNDRVIRIWDYTEDGGTTSSPHTTNALVPTLQLYGHQSSVDYISVHAPSSRVLSASSDHTVGLWSPRKSESPAASETLLPTAAPEANKRRRLNSSDLDHSVAQRGPLSILRGHSDVVSAAGFAANDASVGYSTSWDRSLVTWDLTTGVEVSTRRTMHPLLCVTELPELGLLAAGSSARHLAMIDPRVDVRDVSSLTLRGHVGAVVTACADPEKPWGLLSGSHDGTCRIWDLRSVKMNDRTSVGTSGGTAGQVCQSVYIIHRESGKDAKSSLGESSKVFSVCWDQEVGIVSAGEDRRIQVNQAVTR